MWDFVGACFCLRLEGVLATTPRPGVIADMDRSDATPPGQNRLAEATAAHVLSFAQNALFWPAYPPHTQIHADPKHA